MEHTDRRRAALWLCAGVGLIFASQVRFGIGMLAWLAPIPLLHYLRITTGRRSRLLLAGAIFAGWHLTVVKIVTPPMTYFMVPMYGIPLAVFTAIPLLAWDAVRRRVGEAISIFFYVSLVVLMEWLTYTTGLFGTWGALANTQSYNLPLIQLVSLGGTTAVAFLMSWGAALGEAALASALPAWRRHAAAFGVVFLLVNGYGVLRLEHRQAGPELRVAGRSAVVRLARNRSHSLRDRQTARRRGRVFGAAAGTGVHLCGMGRHGPPPRDARLFLQQGPHSVGATPCYADPYALQPDR